MEIQVLAIFLGHLFGDKIFQFPFIGKNKGKDPNLLLLHIAIYMICLLLSMLIVAQLTLVQAAVFTYINTAMHWLTDSYSAPAIFKASERKDRKLFLKYLFLDQSSHALGFLITYLILLY